MNINELEKRNKVLEKRWKLVLLVAALFLISRPVALYILNNYIHKAEETAINNKYPLLDPSRQFTPQENYIINFQEIRNFLSSYQVKYPDSVSIYFEYLNSGGNISVNKDLHLWAASMTKLPVAMAAMKKIDTGEWTFDDTFELSKEDINGRSGLLYQKPVGTKLSVKDLLAYSLVNSDNTANNLLKRNLSESDERRVIDEMGLDELFDEDGKVSAKEYSRLFRSLYTSSFLKPENSQQILEWISESDFKDFLSKGFPSGVKFAHKWGENDTYGIYGDSGIVYAPGRPYVITFIIKLDQSDAAENRREADRIMTEISKKIFQFVSSR